MSAEVVGFLFCLGRAATSVLRKQSAKTVQIIVKAVFISRNYSKARGLGKCGLNCCLGCEIVREVGFPPTGRL